MKLDLGCGQVKQPDFHGVDKSPYGPVDTLHDLEVFPWPFRDDSTRLILCSHLLEFIKPWLMIDFMNEAWRILEPDGSLLIATPYAGTMSAHLDPLTVSKGFVEATWQYFDPKAPLWTVYRPKPYNLVEVDVDRTSNMNIRCTAIKRGSKLVDKELLDALIEMEVI